MIPLLYKFKIPSLQLFSVCGCTARFVSALGGNPKDRFCHEEAQILLALFSELVLPDPETAFPSCNPVFNCMCLSGSNTSWAKGLDMSFFGGRGLPRTIFLYFSSQLKDEGRPKAAFWDCTEI